MLAAGVSSLHSIVDESGSKAAKRGKISDNFGVFAAMVSKDETVTSGWPGSPYSVGLSDWREKRKYLLSKFAIFLINSGKCTGLVPGVNRFYPNL